jgi:hypothetical protein
MPRARRDADVRLADDLPEVIDGECLGDGSVPTQIADIHHAVRGRPQEGAHLIVSRAAVAHHLPEVIDPVSDREGTAQGPQVRHRAGRSPEERVEGYTRIRHVARHVALVVDRVPLGRREPAQTAEILRRGPENDAVRRRRRGGQEAVPATGERH